MIAAAQAVEHYEITRYGTLIAWANQLGKTDVVKLLRANLEQEYAADQQAHRPRREGAEPRGRLTPARRAAIAATGCGAAAFGPAIALASPGAIL